MARERGSTSPGGRVSGAQLVVMLRPRTGARALREIARTAGAPLRPVFAPATARSRREVSRFRAITGPRFPDLSVFFHVLAPEQQFEALLDRLLRLSPVEAAYVKPATEPPVVLGPRPRSAAPLPVTTPDFTELQGYLGPAPAGIDARHAWTVPGGKGAGVRIVDVERAWRFSHEDLVEHQGGLIGGHPPDDVKPRDHGTAVAGVAGGDGNAFGVTGTCPAASFGAVSIMVAVPGFGVIESTAWAIWRAAWALAPGDIILLELHRPGPRFGFEPRADQRGYIPVEWWPCDWAAILHAALRGVLVVEAAGNGEENLDDPLYDKPERGFPPGWRNPFRRRSRDSRAVVVGAGAPPPGTHGHDWGIDRSRLSFSNHGSIVDAQGWGREVTSCGYGDLQGGENEDRWYTNQFGGTSSASPMVAGALASVQGILRAARKAVLTPLEARTVLRATGSPQQADRGTPVTQRIGARPDLRQIVSHVLDRPGAPAGRTVERQRSIRAMTRSTRRGATRLGGPSRRARRGTR